MEIGSIWNLIMVPDGTNVKGRSNLAAHQIDTADRMKTDLENRRPPVLEPKETTASKPERSMSGRKKL